MNEMFSVCFIFYATLHLIEIQINSGNTGSNVLFKINLKYGLSKIEIQTEDDKIKHS